MLILAVPVVFSFFQRRKVSSRLVCVFSNSNDFCCQLSPTADRYIDSTKKQKTKKSWTNLAGHWPFSHW